MPPCEAINFYRRSGIDESAVEMGVIDHVPRWASLYLCLCPLLMSVAYVHIAQVRVLFNRVDLTACNQHLHTRNRRVAHVYHHSTTVRLYHSEGGITISTDNYRLREPAALELAFDLCIYIHQARRKGLGIVPPGAFTIRQVACEEGIA
jgi:hypothetical protein